MFKSIWRFFGDVFYEASLDRKIVFGLVLAVLLAAVLVIGLVTTN